MAPFAEKPPGAAVHSPDHSLADVDLLRSCITISRQHDADVQQRQILASLDRGKTVTLMFGQKMTQEVTPGSHVLHVNNTLFWKTVRFTIEPGEHLEFVVVNRAGPMTLSFLALLGVAPLYLTVERRSLA